MKKEIVKIIYRCGKTKEERTEGRERGGGGKQSGQWRERSGAEQMG